MLDCAVPAGYADNTKEAELTVGSKCSLFVVKFFGQGQDQRAKRDTCICRWQRKFQSLRSSDLK